MSEAVPSAPNPPLPTDPKPFTPQQAAAARMAAFSQSLTPYTPKLYVATTIIGINFALWIAQIATGVHFFSPLDVDLLRWGADYAPRVASGQWWRPITSMFLHIGILHLAMNMIALWGIGPFIERLVGNGGFLVLYLFAGVCGSLASLTHAPTMVSAGASGAIFGLYGALAGFLLRAHGTLPKDILQQLWKTAGLFIFYNVLYGMQMANIDQAAHLGGLAGGFIGGLILGHPLDPSEFSGRARRAAIVAVLGVAGYAAGVMTMPNIIKERTAKLTQAENMLKETMGQKD